MINEEFPDTVPPPCALGVVREWLVEVSREFTRKLYRDERKFAEFVDLGGES